MKDLIIPRAIIEPANFIAECAANGMSRDEAEGAMRAEFLRTFERREFFDVVVANLQDECGREWDPFRAVDNALLGHYGRRTQGADRLARFLASGVIALGAPLSDPLDHTHKPAPSVPMSAFGPLLWVRSEGPRLRFAPRSVAQVQNTRLSWLYESFDPWEKDAFTAHQVRRVPFERAPGWWRRAAARNGRRRCQYVLSCAGGWGGRVGKFRTIEVFLGSNTGAPASWWPGPGGDFDNEIGFAAAMTHALPSAWTADIKLDGAPTVRLVIGPHEAKDLFRLREIEDGAQRRAALLHLVRAHERRRHATPHEASQVREHLRGRPSCTWGGCSVSIAAPTQSSDIWEVTG